MMTSQLPDSPTRTYSEAGNSFPHPADSLNALVNKCIQIEKEKERKKNDPSEFEISTGNIFKKSGLSL